MSCQVKYTKHGQEILSPIFGDAKIADGYARAVGGIVIPSSVIAPPVNILRVADPKVIDRARAKAIREARQNELGEIEFEARKAAKEKGFSEERIEALGKAARQTAIDEEKDANYSTCTLCGKTVYGGFSTCRNCGRL